ncbi:aldolase/citrate lyase family protein [Halobaculum sp. CBA1158]|uniref:HpcH/HpaI aldolase family protein n=1 Tax=Halobaculum sp. CBA1158 TaxID=2904243 RepID=UPI001F1C1F0B|nr:aldolase/citrate lyase family protein [Halobaculum sp. CBA1158]UIO99474.1 aldolase/citrate lyase family protein [Halobaculum sp. CBA1158]
MTDRSGLRATLRANPAGHWLSLPSPQVAEALALTDADFVVIDTEHAPTGIETVEETVRAVDAAGDGGRDRGGDACDDRAGDACDDRAGDACDDRGGDACDDRGGDGDATETAPVVRVAWNDHVRIKRVLDTGAAGVMAPQVNAREEAESFVAAARYPPAGRRGVAGARASGYGRDLADYYADANDRVATIAQIETAEAVANAGDIAGVDGLDALLVGPADLSSDLGVFGEYGSERFESAVGDVLDASEIPVGTLATSPTEVDRWASLGFDFQIVGTDAGYLLDGAEASLARYDRRGAE